MNTNNTPIFTLHITGVDTREKLSKALRTIANQLDSTIPAEYIDGSEFRNLSITFTKTN